MSKIEQFEDLEAWKRARDLANAADDLTPTCSKLRFARPDMTCSSISDVEYRREI